LDEKLDTLILSQPNATLLDYVQRSDEQVIAQFAANVSALANSVSFVNASLSTSFSTMSIRLDSNVADITRHLANIDSTVSNLNHTFISSNNDPNVWNGDAYTSILPSTVREVTGTVIIDSDTSHLTNLVTITIGVYCAQLVDTGYTSPCVANFPALQYVGDLTLGTIYNAFQWNVSMPMLSRVGVALYIATCSSNVVFPSLLQVNRGISVQGCNSFNVSLPALTTVGGRILLNGVNSFNANNLVRAKDLPTAI
jgi:hypothetical protein